jgi:pimeloyl-ACP methyl ester carboxylesterase
VPIADVGDARLYYSLRGDGPPVLGIMGFALDQRFWAGQVPAVTQTHSFITFDNRGIGRSTGEPPTSIDQMAGDAIALLDHLEIDKAVIFGVSMGGAIAQRLAVEHPERVAGLILAVTWARPIEFMRRQHDIARLIIQTSRGVDALIEVSLVRMFTPRFFELGREVIDRLVGAFMAEGGPGMPVKDVLLAQLDALDKHDVLADLPSISCPTLVLGGETDMMVPGFASKEISEAIPGAELEMFRTGHGCMIEELEPFNAAVSKFLASLPQR